MAHTTLHPVRRLLLAILAGGGLMAAISAIVTNPSADSASSSSASNVHTSPAANDDVSRREERRGTAVGLSARAEGIVITGMAPMAASPSISATSGRLHATEPVVQSPGDLVTIRGVELTAAVVEETSSAHAMVQHATYGRHDLGRLAVSCRNGVPTAERTGTHHLTANVLVDYGQAHGQHVTGATVLVLGPADRVTRIIKIATVFCASPYRPFPAAPERADPPNDSTPPRPGTPASTPSVETAEDSIPPAPTADGGNRIERRLVPRTPAPSTRIGHLIVTG